MPIHSWIRVSSYSQITRDLDPTFWLSIQLFRVFGPKTTLTEIMLYPNLENTLQKKCLMKACHFCGILLPTAK